MSHINSDAPFRADLDFQGFNPSAEEYLHIDTEIDRIKPMIRDFPTQILHVNIDFSQRSQEYRVKLALILPGQTFATGQTGGAWEPCLEDSVSKLIARIEHYKSDMSGQMYRSHTAAGTKATVEPTQQIDGERVQHAIESGNYTEFRNSMLPIEGSLRERIGRWIQRYPEVEKRIGRQFTIDDIVEETFLMAFQRFAQWHPHSLFGQWIETLIDPSLKALISDPEGELEAISFQRTWSQAESEKSTED